MSLNYNVIVYNFLPRIKRIIASLRGGTTKQSLFSTTDSQIFISLFLEFLKSEFYVVYCKQNTPLAPLERGTCSFRKSYIVNLTYCNYFLLSITLDRRFNNLHHVRAFLSGNGFRLVLSYRLIHAVKIIVIIPLKCRDFFSNDFSV